MPLTPFHDPKGGPLHVVGLMSGSGTNLLRILEHQKKLEEERGKAPYEIVAIFSDNKKSNAVAIGAEYDLPVIVRDIRRFYKVRGLKRMDMTNREMFDRETIRALAPFNAKVAVYAGYMSIASELLIKSFMGVNVHPGDLSQELEGKRRWVGDHAVRDAILAGQKTIASSTNIIEPEVDGVLVVSVIPGSQAAEKRIMPGDVIVKVAQESVSDPKDVEEQVARAKSEGLKSVLLQISRSGETSFVALRVEGS